MYSKIAILAILAITLPSAAFALDATSPQNQLKAEADKREADIQASMKKIDSIDLMASKLGIPPEENNAKIKVLSLSGKVQVFKNNTPAFDMDENTPLPFTLDSGSKIKVITGKGVFSTGLLTVTGAAGSEFTLQGTRNAMRLISGAGTPVEAKDKLGNTYVFTENSDATFGISEKGYTAAVNQGRLLQSNSKGETSIVGSGESLVLMPMPDGAPLVTDRPASTAKTKTPPETTGESILTQIIPPAPATNVIPTKEEAESEHVISRSAP